MPYQVPERLQVFERQVKGEDRQGTAVLSDGSCLLVVADGHGGHECAEHAVPIFVRTFSAEYQGEAKVALKRAAGAAINSTMGYDAGAVYTAVWLSSEGTTLRYAQLGDTFACWRRADGGAFARTPDHNSGNNPTEREAAVKRGGLYHGGYVMAPSGQYGLQPTRALGDAMMGTIIEKNPEMGVADVAAGSWIIVSSDGVLGMSHTSAEAEQAAMAKLLAALERSGDLRRAVTEASEGPLFDDVTVLAVPVP